MKVQTTNLIQVKTLKAKLAKQIHFVVFTTEEHQQLRANLILGNCSVCGWTTANALDRGSERMRIWLVEGPAPGTLRWFIAPESKDYEGKPVELAEKYKDVPQLFID